MKNLRGEFLPVFEYSHLQCTYLASLVGISELGYLQAGLSNRSTGNNHLARGKYCYQLLRISCGAHT